MANGKPPPQKRKVNAKKAGAPLKNSSKADETTFEGPIPAPVGPVDATAVPIEHSTIAEGQIHVVALGASAGGLEAFELFFGALPSDTGMAFIVIAHLDPKHVSLLPELIQKCTTMRVCQVQKETRVEANSVYVIPPNRKLSIHDGVLGLTERSQLRGTNLPIDSFFRSLAHDQGPQAIGIILSGTGMDGSLGLRAIKESLGMVMAQEVSSAKYDGMPRSAFDTGLVDYVLPPEKMPAVLLDYVKRALVTTSVNDRPKSVSTPDALQKIFMILRERTDHDFSLYKKKTICRRIERRMNIHQINDIWEYVQYLRDSDNESGILFKEFLIGVTNFFRDPPAFEVLLNDILPKLLAEKPDGYTFRVWVPGCSSGEEAYSLAIALHECMETANRCNIQIFGTDIDEAAINWARGGSTPQRLNWM